VLVAGALLAACAANRPPEQRANRPMPPGSIVGAPSPQWDTPARLKSGDAPIYPIGQLLNGKVGHAKMAFTVAEDGSTRDIRVGEATSAVFGRHAAIAVKGWRFEPATLHGLPVASSLDIDLSFDIARNFDPPPSPSDRRR
jgi:TonB family protein